MHAPLFLNHAAFFFNRTVVKVELARQVLQHQQDGVEQFSTLGRHIGDLESGVVKSSRSIDVATIGHAVVLQDVHHVDVREIACSLKCDVLDEMGQALLILLLDQ